MRRAIAAAALAAALAAGCSQQREYKQNGGRCVVHDTDRVFGIPVDQREYDCPKETNS